MKTRLVLWGTDANEERVLIAMSLNAREKKIDIWTFPEQVATEDLDNRLFKEWRMGKDIPFPNVFIQIERPLSATEPLLPEDIKADNPELIERAQTEWQFVVLSMRMYDMYREELEFLKTKVEDLSKFDNALWEELKGYWEKVQLQIQDKNLFRDHAQSLKHETNSLFSKMKDLRRSLDEEFRDKSKENVERFSVLIENIESRVEQGLGLKPLFDELKSIQKEFRNAKFTKEDRSRIWQRLDKAFKDIKQKRFGKGYDKDPSAFERLKRRYDGLLSAVDKMEKSIARDKRDLEVQDKRIESSAGQFEEQILIAKRAMIQGRVDSKESKLQEMYKTKEDLERKIEIEQKKAEERKMREEVEETKEHLKEKLKEEIREAAAARDDSAEPHSGEPGAQTDGQQAAAGEKVKDKLSASAAALIGDSVKDLSDTVRAVAEVVSEKVQEAVRELSEEEE